MKIGVLALQGDVREHLRSLSDCGVSATPVKRIEELGDIDGLVIPGGESTTIAKLARAFGLMEPIRDRIKAGMPVYGSCAGMILISDRVLDAIEGQETFGGLDVTVRRNAFGRQVDSFETDLKFDGITEPPFRAIFIRAPWIESVGPNATVLSQIDGRAVAVRQGSLLATSFHPELTGDSRIHRYFVEEICNRAITSKEMKVGR